jgi:uncharacterized membrane protein
MFRSKAKMKKKQESDPIRWRSHEVGRIEAFTDAVFAFAVTLLIVSLEVPKSFDELVKDLLGFIPFGLGFIFLFWIWNMQHEFFRRFGLFDERTTTLNAILIFLVLFFVYPLKFLAHTLVEMIVFQNITMNAVEMTRLMIIYSSGYFMVFLMLILMYRHALSKRVELELTEAEVFETKTSIYTNTILASMGLLSIVLALLFPLAPIVAGLVYSLTGIPLSIMHNQRKKIHRLRFETITEGHKPVAENSPLK